MIQIKYILSIIKSTLHYIGNAYQHRIGTFSTFFAGINQKLKKYT